jgi:hypothetical protein
MSHTSHAALAHGDISQEHDLGRHTTTVSGYRRRTDSRRCFGTCVGGEGVSHGAESAGTGARLMTTSECDRRTASVIVDAKTVPVGLDSGPADCAQQSSAAAREICVRGAPCS